MDHVPRHQGWLDRWEGFVRAPTEQRSIAPVFFLTLAVILTSPFLMDSRVGRATGTALVGLSAVVALQRTGAHTVLRRGAIAIVVLSTLVSAAGPTLAGTSGADAVEILASALFALLLLVTPLVLLLRLMLRPRITMDTVAGALAAYLQIGLFFGAVFRLVSLVETQPFFAQTGEHITTFSFTYFSFVTITTTGYGDLTPATPAGQALANIEQILGQVFLVTVVALIVSNLGRELPRRHRPAADEAATDDG